MKISRHTVLIVDDEPEVLDSLRRILRDQDYRILSTTSPVEALSMIEGGGIDVLISDIDMPGMTGIELVARVRQSYPDVVRMLLTGGASLDSALRAINEGEVYRYLTKPWDKAVLRETIRQALDRLDELRRAAGATRAVLLRERMLSELETMHPGIRTVTLDGTDYPLDLDRLDGVAATLASPTLRTFFSR